MRLFDTMPRIFCSLLPKLLYFAPWSFWPHAPCSLYFWTPCRVSHMHMHKFMYIFIYILLYIQLYHVYTELQNYRNMEPWIQVSVVPWIQNHGTTELQKYGTINPHFCGSMNLELQNHESRTMETWNYRTTEEWNHRFIKSLVFSWIPETILIELWKWHFEI